MPRIPNKINALIDTGSQINVISEDWYRDNKLNLGKIDILKMSNTIVKGAIGNLSLIHI